MLEQVGRYRGRHRNVLRHDAIPFLTDATAPRGWH
jgi:hypothetical protein